MNEYQTKLYNDLFALAQSNEAFYYSDQELDGQHYRIFLYRLASYTDFCEPNALESRGVMFKMDSGYPEAEPYRVMSLPFEKFFNVRENLFTMDLDFDKVIRIEDKHDGSLISTYFHYPCGESVVKLKTKGSIASDQAMDAMEWLETQKELKYELWSLASVGITVMMEWIAPNNRIVLPYDKPNLVVLAARDLYTGEYVNKEDLKTYKKVYESWVDEYLDYVEKDYETVQEFVEFVIDPNNESHLLEGVEGYVLIFANGQRAKIKSQWYLSRHRARNSINCPRRLFEAVIDEATDDLRTLFFGDVLAIRQIDEMEKFAEKHYNHMCDTVERFFERNKDLDRKSYAILGQKELERPHFNLAMMKYVGKVPNYKESIKKRWRDFGLKDEVQLAEGEE